MRRLFALLALPALASLTACASGSSQAIVDHLPASQGTAVPLGKAVEVGDLVAKPLEIVEDSRCPENARCVWAGRLIVRTRLGTGQWSETANLVLGEPHVTHGFTIRLVSGQPEKQADRATPPEAYRFAFEQGRQLSVARLGERVSVDGPYVTPVAVVEDSRCPAGVQCVSAGQVRVRITVHLGSGDQTRELTLGEPVPVADGALELVEVQPAPVVGEPIRPADYRFTFRFDGGL